MAPDRSLYSLGADRPDVDEEDIPIRLPAGRAIEAARDVDVSVGDLAVEGIGPVGAVVDGQSRRADRGDRGQDRQGGRPIGPERVAEPARRDGYERQRRGRPGRDRRGRGRGDPQDEGGR
jgi:hypothetical protein